MSKNSANNDREKVSNEEYKNFALKKRNEYVESMGSYPQKKVLDAKSGPMSARSQRGVLDFLWV